MNELAMTAYIKWTDVNRKAERGGGSQWSFVEGYEYAQADSRAKVERLETELANWKDISRDAHEVTEEQAIDLATLRERETRLRRALKIKAAEWYGHSLGGRYHCDECMLLLKEMSQELDAALAATEPPGHQHTDACYSDVPETEGTGQYLRCKLTASEPGDSGENKSSSCEHQLSESESNYYDNRPNLPRLCKRCAMEERAR